MDRIRKLMIGDELTIKEAWRCLNDSGYKVLFVVGKSEQLMGTLTDGDIRRWILADKSIQDSVSKIVHKRPIVANETDAASDIKSKMLEHRIECVPVLDADGRVVRAIFWDDFFREDGDVAVSQIDAEVVIMAGGNGTRLAPYTKVLPKPLVPLGSKPIIQHIMERFWKFGMQHYILSLRYKSNMIKAFFADADLPYRVDYVTEEEPLGTAGALLLMQSQLTKPFFVTNCDILVEADYKEIYDHHMTEKNAITVVSSLKHFKIPYGTIEIKGGGELQKMTEKPELDFLVNTGLYVVDPHVISLIPKNQLFHLTDLIDLVRGQGGKVGVYPISEKAWVDVGQLEEYLTIQKQFE